MARSSTTFTPKKIEIRITKQGCHECISHWHDKAGYVTIKRKGKHYKLHRSVWEETNGPIPEGLLICHHCDNPSCINLEHLFIGIYKDNTQDMMKKGRHNHGFKKGGENVGAKLQISDVKRIRSLKSKQIAKLIAEDFRISIWTVREIWQGRTWKHVP